MSIDPRTAPDGSGPGSEKLGLCLSGGGLRATFFHLGLIQRLRRDGLLRDVAHIVSVSGGSILAAHLILNWERYVDADDDVFEKAKAELIAFGRRDVRGRVVRRWLLGLTAPFLGLSISRTNLLQAEYDALYGGKTLHDLGGGGGRRPEIHIATTSFTTGRLCAFGREGLWVQEEPKARLLPTGMLPVSFAVAASSAFPPLFPPVPLTRRMLDAEQSELAYDPEYLSDGGVFDNLGFETLARVASAPGSEVRRLIVSDAGGRFDWDVERQFSWIVSRTVRATDILMKRLADHTLSRALSGASPAIHVAITARLGAETPDALPIDVQKRLPKVRTDLDGFSALEIELLIRHGDAVGGRELAKAGLGPKPPRPDALHPPMDGAAAGRLVRRLHRSDKRSVGLANARDPASYALAAWACILLAAPFLTLLVQYREVVVKNQEADVIKGQAEDLRAEASAPARPPTGPAGPGAVDRSAFKVFVQFAGSIQREDVRDAMRRTAEAGWRVLGIGKGGQRTPLAAGLDEVRYRPGDEAAARLLAGEFPPSLGGGPLKTVPVASIEPGALEIWVSR